MPQIDLPRESLLFSNCTEEDLVRLAAIGRTREYGDGELLFAQGDEARELMVISSGMVQLELLVNVLGGDRSIAFETKGRGTVIGWSAVVPPHIFTLSGRAAGDTQVAAFGRDDLNALFGSDTALCCKVLNNLLSIVRVRLERTHTLWAREVQQNLDERYR